MKKLIIQICCYWFSKKYLQPAIPWHKNICHYRYLNEINSNSSWKKSKNVPIGLSVEYSSKQKKESTLPFIHHYVLWDFFPFLGYLPEWKSCLRKSIIEHKGEWHRKWTFFSLSLDRCSTDNTVKMLSLIFQLSFWLNKVSNYVQFRALLPKTACECKVSENHKITVVFVCILFY